MLLALSLMSPVAGAIIYHRTVVRYAFLWPLASGLVAYNACFFLGFMNYLLSLGLALAGALPGSRFVGGIVRAGRRSPAR
jgi:hypothetical protein